MARRRKADMARRRKADMTYAQRVAADNDAFRAEAYAAHLDEAAAAPVNDDIAKFRKDAYKEALRDAKAQQKA